MVQQGYIHDKLDLKMLELYLLARAAGPVDPNTLADLVLCHEGVDYFSFVEATNELVESGHFILDDHGYTITPKGRSASAHTEVSLPYSVRRRCGQDLAPLNATLRRNAQIHGETVTRDNGDLAARLTMDDDGGNLLTIELLCPSREQAERMIRAFKTRPEQIYNDVLEALSEPSRADESSAPELEKSEFHDAEEEADHV